MEPTYVNLHAQADQQLLYQKEGVWLGLHARPALTVTCQFHLSCCVPPSLLGTIDHVKTI